MADSTFTIPVGYSLIIYTGATVRAKDVFSPSKVSSITTYSPNGKGKQTNLLNGRPTSLTYLQAGGAYEVLAKVAFPAPDGVTAVHIPLPPVVVPPVVVTSPVVIPPSVSGDVFTAATVTPALDGILSVGVRHKTTKRLLLTLVSGYQVRKGVLTPIPQWDYKNPAGVAIDPTPYEIVAQISRVKFGIGTLVGNTSAAFDAHVYHSYASFRNITRTRTGDFVSAAAYAEVYAGLNYSPGGTVQSPRHLDDWNSYESFVFNAANSKSIFAVTNNSGFDTKASSLVQRWDVDTKAPKPFSAGTPVISGD
jgi:hypothetical protein